MRWRSAEILLFSIDWKISGLMIKVYNTRSYSALPGQTARVIWLERYDWKSVAMEILLKLNLSFSALALYKEKARWLQRSKKSDEGREFKWETKEMGYVRVFIWAHRLTFSNLSKESNSIMREEWEVIYCLKKQLITWLLYMCLCLCAKKERNKDRLGNLAEGEMNSVYIYVCVGYTNVYPWFCLLFLWALKYKSPSSQSWHWSMFKFCYGYKMSVKPYCDF